MARLPYVDPERASAPTREALEALPPLNIFRMLANADSAFRPWLRWGAALLGQLELDPVLRELAILRVARLTPHAEYEWVQHVPIFEAVGGRAEQVEALEREETSAACFSEQERAVIEFTTEVVREARAGDGSFEAVRSFLSPREVVELLMVIGNYMLVARVMATAELEIDPPAGAEGLRIVSEQR
ncbi:MAG: carboxymuconolactone decarboxylase family protein [Solirubrobacterales bacterium]